MRILRSVVMILLAAGITVAQGAGAGKAPEEPKQIPSFNPADLDRSADPCVDFYQFSCGGWLKNNPIPPDQAAWGRFNELAERNRAFLREILENAAKATKRTPEEQKIGDYYASCVDEDAINKKGIAALKPEFDRIDAAKTKNDLTPLIAYL